MVVMQRKAMKLAGLSRDLAAKEMYYHTTPKTNMAMENHHF